MMDNGNISDEFKRYAVVQITARSYPFIKRVPRERLTGLSATPTRCQTMRGKPMRSGPMGRITTSRSITMNSEI